jgi:hypothetical protein
MGMNLIEATPGLSSTSLNVQPILDDQSFFPVEPDRERIGPLGLEVGTGGSATCSYVVLRGDRGYPFAVYQWPRRIAEANVGVTAVENIGRIRAVLIPNMTDLAGLLSVSRQAIYDWRAGEPIAAENSARLNDLAKAADLLEIEGLRGTPQALRRPIRDGKTFLELVKEGAPAESAARALIQIIRTENNQREALSKRLAGRKRPSRESFEEIGIPMLNEEDR